MPKHSTDADITPQTGSLKPWEILFCREYLRNNNNATRAYETVNPNVTLKTAQVQGSKTLKRAIIQKYIQREMEKVDGFLASGHKITTEKLTQDAQDFIEMAKEDRNPSAGLKGVELQGRMHGLMDKRERESEGWRTLIESITVNIGNSTQALDSKPVEPKQITDATFTEEQPE